MDSAQVYRKNFAGLRAIVSGGTPRTRRGECDGRVSYGSF